MDEYKDYEKDLVAHPNRPLPRGVVTINQVQQLINVGLLGMLAIAVMAMMLHSFPSAICYALVIGYLWLMYKEFYAGQWLSSKPALYALSHQIIIIPLCLFTPLLIQSRAIADINVVYFSLLILTSFFSFEICRKLDPDAHPILHTYLSHYGIGITSIMIAALTLTGSFMAYKMNLELFLWPAQVILLLSLFVLKIAPKKFKIPEGVATLSLVLHLWVIPLRHLVG